ncbi:MAG: DNA mismatch repair endonuclease MutL [Nitrospiraceae bacterium]
MPGVIHSQIQVLPDDLVGRIAAGEVVERPAAVVKELLDNSLDAGATSIAVVVEQGGVGRIAVTDDGIGMSREDATLAFRRHATSKLRTEADLWSLKTLGFRGEALPSIAAVSRVEVTTATGDGAVGIRLVLDGGTIQSVQDAARARGTHIDIRELFFNTPARKKFLKSVTTEFAHIVQIVQQAALAWPQVQFSLQHNTQEPVTFEAAASLRDRVGQVYRGTFIGQTVPVLAEQPGLWIEGWVIQSDHARGSRTPQDIFVNRRAIKNPTILHAVTDAYGPVLPRGRYPQFVLFLDMDPARVDVNVHPTKREVRFAEKDWIHSAVRQAVRSALQATPGTQTAPSASVGRAPSSYAPTGGNVGAARSAVGRVVQESLGAQIAARLPHAGERSALHHAVESAAHDAVNESLYPAWAPSVAGGHDAAASAEAARAEGRAIEIVPFGQVARTYLVACVGDELQIIDQHTAHERVLYERLWRARQARAVDAQTLVTPIPLELPAHQRALLEPHLDELEQVGLVLERFGSDGYVLRSVPATLKAADGAALVQGLLEDMDEWYSHSTTDAKLHKVVATLACHSAVQAGRQMALPELATLVREWVGEGMIMTCPHGRRVAMRLPIGELGRIFGRE